MSFEGFSTQTVATPQADIRVRVGGAGPPLLLLHGYPETHYMWHAVAPALADAFTVVCADLRGYGDSSKPEPAADGRTYAKREMAADQVAVMRALGFDRFGVAGHDRGGRVAHRMALDHPEAVARVAVLDIVPTRTVFATVDQALATAYYHWFFLIQPGGLPERMIGADPDAYLTHTLRSWAAPGFAFDPVARAEYARCFADPRTIAASCADYRAAATCDLADDAGDAGPLTQPLLALWGARGAMHRIYDVAATWVALAPQTTGRALDCGHFLPEERPAETAAALAEFFGAVG